MTKRDFEVVAETIRTAPDIGPHQREVLAVHFSRHLAAVEERFDAGLFVRAATGLDSLVREAKLTPAPPAICIDCGAEAKAEGSSRVYSIQHAPGCPQGDTPSGWREGSTDAQPYGGEGEDARGPRT